MDATVWQLTFTLHFVLKAGFVFFSAVSLLTPGWLACKLLDDSLVFAIFL